MENFAYNTKILRNDKKYSKIFLKLWLPQFFREWIWTQIRVEILGWIRMQIRNTAPPPPPIHCACSKTEPLTTGNVSPHDTSTTKLMISGPGVWGVDLVFRPAADSSHCAADPGEQRIHSVAACPRREARCIHSRGYHNQGHVARHVSHDQLFAPPAVAAAAEPSDRCQQLRVNW